MDHNKNLLGLLRIHIQRGVNLAVRDFRSSDPYVLVRMGKHKVMTRVVTRNLNPEWNDDLTITIRIGDPSLPVKLTVYDRDTFTFDDKMGDAEFDIRPFFEAVKTRPESLPSGTVIKRLKASRENCLAEESCIIWQNNKLVQNMFLRLRNVECGEVELQLQWIYVGCDKSLIGL